MKEDIDFPYSYSEGEIIQKIIEHIKSTYGQHYVAPESGVQTLDFLMEVCETSDFMRSNAIKYLARFGKKEGKNPKDLLKAVHYIVLMYYFEFLRKRPDNETE